MLCIVFEAASTTANEQVVAGVRSEDVMFTGTPPSYNTNGIYQSHAPFEGLLI